MSEQFRLPDGTMVGTGNIKPVALSTSGPEFPTKMQYMENSDIEAALKRASIKERRKAGAKYMINQGSIGKCNTSAAAAGIYQIRERNGHTHVALADNDMYIRICGGSDRGSLLHDGMADGQKGMAPRVLNDGTRDVGTFPHDAFRTDQVPRKLLELAAQQRGRFKMHEPLRVPKEWDAFKRTVATAMAAGYPLVMAWHVGNDSMRLRNGYARIGRGMGNHASLIHYAKYVGGNDIVHVDLKNSWGPTASSLYGPSSQGWGDGGYGLMTMEDLFACREYHDYYVITGCSEDPWANPLG